MKRKKYKKRSRTRGRPNFEAFGRFDRQGGHLELERVLVTFSQIHTYFKASMTSTTYSPKKKLSTLAKKSKIRLDFFSFEMFFFQLAPGLISKAIFYQLLKKESIFWIHFVLFCYLNSNTHFSEKQSGQQSFHLKLFNFRRKAVHDFFIGSC